MAKLCGIFYFDSRPVPHDDAAWVRRGLVDSHGGPARLLGAAGLLMGYAASSFDSAADDGLVATQEGAICAWDGRLDNRADVLAELGRDVPSQCSNSALALSLYRVKGAGGLGGLIGDWSLAMWDPAWHRALLASDYAGVRPLYYCRSVDCLMWASSLSHLVRWSGRNEIDEPYAASFLTRGSAVNRTPYRGIYPVPPGHAVCVTPGGASTQAFWDLPVHGETRFGNRECYEEQLRNLFRESVSVRLAADAPTCADLSGGLDSSSIVCMADSIAHERSNGALRPVTFTYTHKGSTDEKYFRAVERARNVTGIHLDLEQHPFVAVNQAGKAAPAWWEPRLTELARLLADMGSAVYLTGQLGDLVMGNTMDDSGQVADCLRGGQWLSAVREAFEWSHALRAPVYPILWRALRSHYSSWTPAADTGRSSGVSGYAQGDSLAKEFRKKLPDFERELDGHRGRRWQEASPSRRWRFRALSEMLEARTLQTPEPLQHISYTHPFAHRPLVEFMLTIPPAEVCRPGEPRRLMRRAFAQLLPAAVLRRKSKAAYTSVYRQALMPLATELLAQPDNIRLVDLGYADRTSVIERLRAFVQGLACNEPQLRQVLLFEFWLRNREAAMLSSTNSSATVAALKSQSSLAPKDDFDFRPPPR
jgi:asparagine synthase (glutamine-hydrolysing)